MIPRKKYRYAFFFKNKNKLGQFLGLGYKKAFKSPTCTLRHPRFATVPSGASSRVVRRVRFSRFPRPLQRWRVLEESRPRFATISLSLGCQLGHLDSFCLVWTPLRIGLRVVVGAQDKKRSMFRKMHWFISSVFKNRLFWKESVDRRLLDQISHSKKSRSYVQIWSQMRSSHPPLFYDFLVWRPLRFTLRPFVVVVFGDCVSWEVSGLAVSVVLRFAEESRLGLVAPFHFCFFLNTGLWSLGLSTCLDRGEINVQCCFLWFGYLTYGLYSNI